MSECIAEILNLAEAQKAPGVSDELRRAFNDAFQALVPADLAALAQGMPALTAAPGAGLLAAWLGAMVERGADPAPLIPPLVETFLGHSARLRTADEEDADDPEPDPALIFGLQELGRALVSMIASSDPARADLAQRAELRRELQRIEHLSHGAMWLEALLAQESGEILVLHVECGQGFIARYRNIANAFHLFTLLQHELAGRLPGARAADAEVIAAAKGGPATDKTDKALWHFGAGTSPEPNIAASIWGEGSPAAIPRIDGVQVLLLWPMILGGRSWSGSFFGPALQQAPPALEVVRELPQEEAARWRERLGLPAPVKKPWWRPW